MLAPSNARSRSSARIEHGIHQPRILQIDSGEDGARPLRALEIGVMEVGVGKIGTVQRGPRKTTYWHAPAGEEASSAPPLQIGIVQQRIV